MFDINAIGKRYFSIKLGDLVLEVEPPKLKALKKITALSESRGQDAMKDLSEAVKMILNKNKNSFDVPDDVIDELDLDQMTEILTAYFKWLANTQKSPN